MASFVLNPDKVLDAITACLSLLALLVGYFTKTAARKTQLQVEEHRAEMRLRLTGRPGNLRL